MRLVALAALVVPAALATIAIVPAAAQSSASTYSYGTYNPVQAAINRNTMNAAVIRQATGGKHRATTTRRTTRTHKTRR